MTERLDRIDYQGGDLDDVAVWDVDLFRLERMSAGHFWLRCYRKGKPDVAIWLTAPRKIKGWHETEPGDG